MKTKSNISQQREEQHILDEIDLQEELNDIFRSISSRIPVDKIHWVQTHYDLRMIRIIAQVSDTARKNNFMYDVPDRSWIF